MEIAAKPMLQHVVERTRQANLVDELLVATTIDPSDDILEQFCQRQSIPIFRGSSQDVLDRIYQAARKHAAQVIVRLTADCPLLDPELIDLTLEAFLGHDVNRNAGHSSILEVEDSVGVFPFDFSANRLPPPWKRTLPIGLDVEVCSMAALQRAWKYAVKPHQREHVMPFLYEGVVFSPPSQASGKEWYVELGSTPSGFKVALLNHDPDYGALRWTVDTPADLEFVRRVYSHFIDEPIFGWQRVLALVRQFPELGSINADVQHKSAFDVDPRTAPS